VRGHVEPGCDTRLGGVFFSVRLKPRQPRIDRSHPLARGLVGAWPMFERGGLTVRDVHRGHDGTLTNMSTSDWVSSPYGPALDFDGNNDYIDTPITEHSDVYTVSAWINLDSWTAPSEKYNHIVSKGSVFDGDHEFALQFRTHSSDITRRYFGFSTKASGVHYSIHSPKPATSTDYPAGTWIHLVGVRDRGHQAMYINGEEKGTPDGPTTTPCGTSSRNIKIGGPYSVISSDAYFNGQIADVKIWNRRLQYSEVLSEFRDPFRLYRLSGSPWNTYGFDLESVLSGGGSPAATSSGDARVFPLFELSALSAGDMVYWSAADSEYKRLPIGSTGETLTVSAGGLPEWA
jgi:hypothetical protein